MRVDRVLRRYPERFIDVGIAEQHAVAAAAGLAMGGFRPVVAIYSTFLNRAWDQLYYDVGLHGLPVIFCIDRAGITGDDGPSHNGVMDLALLTKVPGMTVLAPSSYEEIPVMLAQAIAITSGPVALRWPKTEARHSAATGTGLSARQVRAVRGFASWGWGKWSRSASKRQRSFRRRGVEATVWDVRAAAPLDPLMLCDALRHQVVVTVEDGVVAGGVGQRLPRPSGRRWSPGPPGHRVVWAAFGVFPTGEGDDILSGLGLDAPGLAQKALTLCGRVGTSDPRLPAAYRRGRSAQVMATETVGATQRPIRALIERHAVNGRMGSKSAAVRLGSSSSRRVRRRT